MYRREAKPILMFCRHPTLPKLQGNIALYTRASWHCTINVKDLLKISIIPVVYKKTVHE